MTTRASSPHSLNLPQAVGTGSSRAELQRSLATAFVPFIPNNTVAAGTNDVTLRAETWFFSSLFLTPPRQASEETPSPANYPHILNMAVSVFTNSVQTPSNNDVHYSAQFRFNSFRSRKLESTYLPPKQTPPAPPPVFPDPNLTTPQPSPSCHIQIHTPNHNTLHSTVQPRKQPHNKFFARSSSSSSSSSSQAGDSGARAGGQEASGERIGAVAKGGGGMRVDCVEG
ncbi:hypothetical protein P153DRAFT_387466 [Dothidotthia symphoricarpi CBS 119687]|uniref:Uncharacterized protein n=1 Tax=Dothidotthia symphoricarpi CBS 119687 TaxID=1392245 RepID=A0A6A6A970_9PLEO|nr:uncharacterized protein P153DRAFT_387466 [Dothidotthia symphoricarpi CBS 119687]KAF2127733.1 hypothetical protein P153DRAFT_387466 [Dothidotthia symphoricarpi CBS 119687]